MYTVAYRWIFCPRGGGGGDGGVPYIEAGVLKTGKNSSAKNKWACNRDEGL